MLLLVAYLGILATASHLWDRDEPRFARCAVEMLRSGEYLVPTFNGRLRPDKPVLIYWLMSVPLRLLGVTAFAARLPSVLGMVCACVLTALIGRRLHNARAGLWAMGILGTATTATVLGTLATADGVLTAWITLAFFAFVKWLVDGRRARYWILFAVALAGAQLTKGPVGLAVPLLSVTGTAWFGRRRGLRLGRQGWVGLGLAVLAGTAAFAAWGIPANAASGGELARLGLGEHVLQRMAAPAEGHGAAGILGYIATLPVYVPLLLLGFFPWTMLLPGAIAAIAGDRVGEPPRRALLLGWTVPTFVLMSLVSTKLTHYILPIYPALAIACGAILAGVGDKSDQRRLRQGVWCFAPVAALFAIATAAAGWRLQPGLRAAALTVTGLAMAVAWGRAAHLYGKALAEPAGRIILLASPVLLLTAATFAMPLVEARLKPAPAVAATIRSLLDRHDIPVAARGYKEPTLMFYLNLPPDRSIHTTRLSPPAWAAEPGPGLLVVNRRTLEREGDPRRGRQAGRISTLGTRLSGAAAVDIIILGRDVPAVSASRIGRPGERTAVPASAR